MLGYSTISCVLHQLMRLCSSNKIWQDCYEKCTRRDMRMIEVYLYGIWGLHDGDPYCDLLGYEILM
jgi:hypothetical protein